MLYVGLVAFTLLSVHLAAAQRDPVISFISKKTIVYRGGSAQLSCSVQFAQGLSVMWVKLPLRPGQSDFTISINSKKVPTDPRYTVRHDRDSTTYELQISDIQEVDQGLYECRVPISSSNVIKGSVELVIRLPPVISDNSTRAVVASEGDRVELHCYATGHPQPNITWRRENNALLPTGNAILRGNLLLVNKVKKEDRGRYFCVADNGVGRGTRRNVHIEINFAPVVNVARPKVYQALQYSANLECDVEAYPPANIDWYKDSKEIKNDQQYAISMTSINDQSTGSTLLVKKADSRQFGVYSCQATNILAKNSAEIELKEVELPVCPPACTGFAKLRPIGGANVLSLSPLPVALALSLLHLIYTRT